ncbi:MAG: sigma-70 family RNA polymerase sigma factor [Roseibium sp.]|uniref:sigma-70 family RNA polymerase sigma factor n=1 Tax=Alphaproteobacteria TaxID=28211 RepID=UPI003298D49F
MKISIHGFHGERVEPTLAKPLEITPGDSTESFIRRMKRVKILEREDEARLARLWLNHGDIEARNAMVAAHMHLAISLANKAARGRKAVDDLVQQATLGLIKAAEKFNPDLGFRFSTYSQWWVLAAIQEVRIKTHSIVEIKPSNAQRKMFSTLRWVFTEGEKELRAKGEYPHHYKIREYASEKLGIPVNVIESFEGVLMSQDSSLNVRQSSEEGEGSEWIDSIACEQPGAEEEIGNAQRSIQMSKAVADALGSLNDRERDIIQRRYLADADKRETLEDVGGIYKISRERVRQIEVKALEKMTGFLKRSFGWHASFNDIFA